MGKKRIHELAKELSLTSADLIQKIVEWKLLPGVKLVASSGLEDYLADEISRRVNNPGGESSAAPQVVRRRKKSADQAETAVEAAAEGVEESVDIQDEPPAPAAGTAAEPVETVQPQTFRRPPKSEPATIIATISLPSTKDAPRNVPAIETAKANALPDFVKLVPGGPQTPDPEPRAVAPAPPAEIPAAAAVAAPPAEEAPKPAPIQAQAPAQPEAPRPAPRKITRELSEPPAKIISPPKGFDAARVVGVKPNWKESPPAGPGGRPTSYEPGRRPAGPGRDPKEGGADWAARKTGPAEAGRTPGRAPDFRRPAPAAAAPAAVPDP